MRVGLVPAHIRAVGSGREGWGRGMEGALGVGARLPVWGVAR